MKLVTRSFFNIQQIVVLALLFFAGVNISNLYAYFIYGAFLIVLFVNFRHFLVDKWFVVLLLFSTFYLFLYPSASSSVTTAIKQYNYPICYLIGLNFINNNTTPSAKQQDHQLAVAVAVPAIGTFVHYLLNMFNSFDSVLRNTTDVWTGSIMSATGQVCLAITAIGVFAAWLFSKTTKWMKIIAIAGIVLAFAYNFILAGRTLILIAAMTLIAAFIFSIKTSRPRRQVLIMLFSALFLLLCWLIYYQNWFGVREWILNSNFSARFDLMDFSEDSRMEFRTQYIKHMLDYPFGGGYLRKTYGYAHEIFLDTYSDAGFIPYFLLIAFVIGALVTFFRFISKNDVGDDLKLLLICVYVVIIAEFYLEPILQSVPWLFCMFCIYFGLLKNRCGVTLRLN